MSAVKGCQIYVFCLCFMIMIMMAFIAWNEDIGTASESSDWVKTDCLIKGDATITKNESQQDSSTTYGLSVAVEYEFTSRPECEWCEGTTSRVATTAVGSPGEIGMDYNTVSQLQANLTMGSTHPCWYDPDDQNSVAMSEIDPLVLQVLQAVRTFAKGAFFVALGVFTLMLLFGASKSNGCRGLVSKIRYSLADRRSSRHRSDWDPFDSTAPNETRPSYADALNLGVLNPLDPYHPTASGVPPRAAIRAQQQAAQYEHNSQQNSSSLPRRARRARRMEQEESPSRSPPPSRPLPQPSTVDMEMQERVDVDEQRRRLQDVLRADPAMQRGQEAAPSTVTSAGGNTTTNTPGNRLSGSVLWSATESEKPVGSQVEVVPDTALGDDVTCCVCLSAPKGVMFLPCAHLCCCQPCAQTLSKSSAPLCPICRRGIESIVRPIVV